MVNYNCRDLKLGKLCFYSQLASLFAQEGLGLEDNLFGCLDCVSEGIMDCYVPPVSEEVLLRMLDNCKVDLKRN